MIKTIDIQKFGQFEGYQWSQCTNGSLFKHINIIYGRNYSGKTTLSRIFRCVEKKEIHPNYCDDCNFSFTLEDGIQITQQEIEGLTPLNIRVYNSDFIKDNLNWLHNSDGTIKPFTTLGEINIEIEKRIKDIEQKLGSVDGKVGLEYEFYKKKEDGHKTHEEYNHKQVELNNTLSDKAKKIKLETATYDSPNYNITKIKLDLGDARDEHILNESETDSKKQLLKEEKKTNIKELTEKKPNFSTYYNDAYNLLKRTIVPTEAIRELIENSVLQEWVRHGMEMHRGKRERCAFCNTPIDDESWDRLDSHFNEQSENLRRELEAQTNVLTKAKNSLSDYMNLTKNDFYSTCQSEFEDLKSRWETLANKYTHGIEKLIGYLNQRSEKIFNSLLLGPIDDVSEEVLALLKQLNELIRRNNSISDNLGRQQSRAREELRLSTVSIFSKEIKYLNSTEELDRLLKAAQDYDNEIELIKKEVESLREAKRKLEASAKDESKGAELVNDRLQKYFGHDDLKLIAIGDKSNMQFKITREGNEVKNLSEGECSLISFCYFIAKIEDDLKTAVQNKLIIYIDDPISSLDNNHIFFMFSLIEKVIASQKAYGQLFISTHNLDFLKYLKHITRFSDKEYPEYFLMERRQLKNNKRSYLINMPLHIRDYVTEFNYLFKEIYEVYENRVNKKQHFEDTYNKLYNLPNNMRKFLECYLFYKYPNKSNPLKNLDKMFDDNIPYLINRVINEYSHLVYIDRGWKPMDIDEAEQCATILIEKIKEKDYNQYSALCESIGVNP